MPLTTALPRSAVPTAHPRGRGRRRELPRGQRLCPHDQEGTAALAGARGTPPGQLAWGAAAAGLPRGSPGALMSFGVGAA